MGLEGSLGVLEPSQEVVANVTLLAVKRGVHQIGGLILECSASEGSMSRGSAEQGQVAPKNNMNGGGSAEHQQEEEDDIICDNLGWIEVL